MTEGKEYRENFGMIVPKEAIGIICGCTIIGATGEEFNEFKKWFDSQNYQRLSLGDIKLNIWVRHNDMIVDSVGYSMQKLFDNWKENLPSKEPFSFTTHTFKK